jgi:predicted transglutaminase-like cysteine proteinase
MRPPLASSCLGILIFLSVLFPQAPAMSAAGPAGDRSGLFGTHEVFSSDLRPFTKWARVVARMERELSHPRQSCQGAGAAGACVADRWQALVAELRTLPARDRVLRANEILNSIPYVSAMSNWHDPGYWETPFEFLARGGQCEDYAIAKIAALAASGFPARDLRLVVVRDRLSGLDHAVAIAYVDGTPLLLDNQSKAVEAASQVDRYVPYYSINSDGWWYHQAHG